AEWILSLDGAADAVVNIRAPLAQYTAMRKSQDPGYQSGDGIHPNRYGHWKMAQAIMRKLFNVTLERTPDYVGKPGESRFFKLVEARCLRHTAAWRAHIANPDSPLQEELQRCRDMEAAIQAEVDRPEDAVLERQSEWNGHTKYDFYVNGREAVLLCPKTPAKGNPWVWRAEFLFAFDQADRALLARGWHIAYCRISNQYGCPYAVEQMNAFKQQLVQTYGLASQASLFGFSRGGLYACNYAAAYPHDVSSLYLDAPVLNIASWPGGKGTGKGAAVEWEDCKAVYGIDEAGVGAFSGNPLHRVDSLVAARIPVMLVAGDADESVPYGENGEIFAKRYMELGGDIRVIVKPGVGHHPHSLEDPSPIVEFVETRFYRQ
ncbi:MAG: hypothetical protein K0Q59_5924, partial [Paenibacillus sp.]|nr:hypothetical protein [Paenibacillus sp.]